MKTEFWPLDYDNIDINGKNVIKIFGKNPEGKSICLLDYIENYFYVISKKQEKIKKQLEKESIKSEEVEKNYLGKKVKPLKIHAQFKLFKELTEKIKIIDEEAQILETDINQITRYIIEKNFKPMKKYEIEGEILNASEEFSGLDTILNVDFTLKLKTTKECAKQEIFKPKVLAFDLETEEFEIGKGPILMISVVTDKIKKVLSWKKPHDEKKVPYVETYKDEADMLEAFEELVKKENPDFITGYFSDNFDMPYLRARAEKSRVPMKLGKDNSRILFSRGRMISAKTKGLVHIDVFRFIETAYSQYMQSETLSLNEVSKELLGEEKANDQHRGKKSSQFKAHEWDEYFAYNLQDSVLTYKLFEKIWPDLLGFVEVMQEPIFDVSRDGMSQHVDDYLIHNLNRFNEIAKPKPSNHEIGERRAKRANIGAFVLQPKPSLYENLAMFDFTSYWPSIIVTFNLSASTFLGNSKSQIPKDLPKSKIQEVKIEKETYYFTKEKGFFPELLAEIIEKRKEAKKELKESNDPLVKARSTAYKILANASYGYLGFFGARYYSYESQGATTGISRDFIKNIIEKTNKEKYDVIYADTDGFAFSLNKQTKNETLAFLKKLNKDLPGIMELELEDFYKRGIWVTKRDGEFGAKKKYALINYDGKLKIRGFETVRRDWCKLARKTQSEILGMILNEGNSEKALQKIKDITKKLRERKIEQSELIIKTQLKKPLSEYKANTPHVIIARKMLKEEMPVSMGTLIEYYIAEPENSKKSLVRERAKLPDENGEYDINYYIDKQIIPSVENIFQIFNINIKEELAKNKQKKLSDY